MTTVAVKSTLRPGLLVALKTSIQGNVNTWSNDIERSEERVHTETVRTYADRAEHDRAVQTRSKVRSLLRSVCAQTNFGLLCPEERREQLDAAIAEVSKVVADFNSTAKYSLVWAGVVTGSIAATDLQAVRSINSEVRDMIDAMRNGITAKDASAARDAAERAQQIAQMLAKDAQDLVAEAVQATRKAASAIVKAGKDRKPEALEIAEVNTTVALNVLSAKRGAFLDFDIEAAPVPINGAARTQLDMGA